MASYDQETARTKEPNYHKLKIASKLHINLVMRTPTVRVCSDVVERLSATKRKLALKGKWKSVFGGRHMDTVSKGIHVVFSRDLLAPGNQGKGQTETVTVVELASRKRVQQRSAARIDA